jgi:hypothetical protein
MPKTLVCVDCKQDFEFTDGEEQFFREKFGDDFQVPKRCKPCRQANKERKQQRDQDGGRPQRRG